ncbi:hypothetical protein BJV77DRAFT_709529 [Russula vinacea]|nr:hypothetical protein BJV77DRAFT_709529 [Russula vinacea]
MCATFQNHANLGPSFLFPEPPQTRTMVSTHATNRIQLIQVHTHKRRALIYTWAPYTCLGDEGDGKLFASNGIYEVRYIVVRKFYLSSSFSTVQDVTHNRVYHTGSNHQCNYGPQCAIVIPMALLIAVYISQCCVQGHLLTVPLAVRSHVPEGSLSPRS